MIVTSSEEDGGGVVSDEALGNAGVAEVRGGGGALLQDGGGVDHLHRHGVAVGPRLQAVHLDEHRLPQTPRAVGRHFIRAIKNPSTRIMRE